MSLPEGEKGDEIMAICPRCKEWLVGGVHNCTGTPVPKLPEAKLLKVYAGASVSAEHQVLMDNDQTARAVVPSWDRRLWDFAVQNFLLYAPGGHADRRGLWNGIVGTRTVKQFADMRPAERLALINQLWDAIIDWLDPDQFASEMDDSLEGNGVHNVSSTRVAHAFTTLGVGFRCEKEEDLPRILQQGLQPLYNLPDIAERMGHLVRYTAVQTKTAQGKVGLWKKNKDAVGQTGICVSRSAKGATKFPDQNHVGNVYLFAVKPSNRAYDTEKYQQQRGNAAVWRPGEKLWPSVAAADVLAYVKIQKTGPLNDEMGGWKARVLDDRWTYRGGMAGIFGMSSAVTNYLVAELADLQPGTEVSYPGDEYDFYVTEENF
jgi:hypothetical protein